MARRGLITGHREAIRDARERLLNIDPKKILWGQFDREVIPRAELDEAREAIALGFEVWAPVIVYDGSNRRLVAGAATLAVALELGVKSIPVCSLMGGRDDVARQSERITRFRAENADDPDSLAAGVQHQRVKIKVPAGKRRKGETEANPSVAEPSQPEPDPQAAPVESLPVEPTPTPSTFSDQLRAIIRRDGRTIYAIETAAGVPRGGVGRFLSGERGLTTDTLDRLAGVLGMRVAGPHHRRDRHNHT
jgi:hypothetical protein